MICGLFFRSIDNKSESVFSTISRKLATSADSYGGFKSSNFVVHQSTQVADVRDVSSAWYAKKRNFVIESETTRKSCSRSNCSAYRVRSFELQWPRGRGGSRPSGLSCNFGKQPRGGSDANTIIVKLYVLGQLCSQVPVLPIRPDQSTTSAVNHNPPGESSSLENRKAWFEKNINYFTTTTWDHLNELGAIIAEKEAESFGAASKWRLQRSLKDGCE